MLEQALRLPGVNSMMGTRAWIKDKIRTQDFKFEYCVRYTKIMNAFVKVMVSKGELRTGYPPRRPSDTVPAQGQIYDAVKGTRKHKRRSKSPESWFPFLRTGAVHAAIKELKNRNLMPVLVQAQDTPGGKSSWNNFCEVCVHAAQMHRYAPLVCRVIRLTLLTNLLVFATTMFVFMLLRCILHC